MKNDTKVLDWLIIAVLLLVLVITFIITFSWNHEQPKKKVSVVISDSMNDRWIAMRQGMEQAAADNNIILNFVSSERFDSISEEITMIEKEINNDVDGIVFEPIAGDGYEKLLSNRIGGCSIVLLRSDISPENVYPSVELDNNSIAEKLYTEIINNHPEGLAGHNIVVIAGHTSQLAVEERIDYLKGKPDFEAATKEWMHVDTFEEAIKDESIDIMVAMGDYETEKVIDFVTENHLEDSTEIYGIGYSEKAIYYLDSGTVTSLVLTNEFNMGYLSIEMVSKQMNRGNKNKELIDEIFVVNKENLFNEEYQKILFPQVQ